MLEKCLSRHEKPYGTQNMSNNTEKKEIEFKEDKKYEEKNKKII